MHVSWKPLWPLLSIRRGCQTTPSGKSSVSNPLSLTKTNIKNLSDGDREGCTAVCAGVYLCFSMTDNPSSDVVRVKLKRVTRRPSIGGLLYATRMKMKSNLRNKTTAVFRKRSFKMYFSPLFFFFFFRTSLLLPSFVSAFSLCQWNEILYLPYSSKALQISVWVWWIALN